MNTPVRIALVAVAQLALVATAVAPRLSAYATGEEYRLQVAGLDPHDPFRGAYVDLDYPGLDLEGSRRLDGEVYLPLAEQADGTWASTGVETERPDEGPYLACEADWRLSCGIESWFADDQEALRIQDALAGGTGIATLRIDSRGHAVLLDISVE